MMNRFESWRNYLFRPVDASSLGAFRLVFGLLMVWEMHRYFAENVIYEHFVAPGFYFSYALTPFVVILPEPMMYALFYIMGVTGALIAIGLLSRQASFVFFLCYTYVFLIDKVNFNNHYYLICWLSLFLSVTNCNRWLALDRLIFKDAQLDVVPFWQIFLFRAMMFVVYFFGGLVKLSPDWLKGEPLRWWLTEFASEYAEYFPGINNEWNTYFLSYGGAIFDLTIGFMLLWRPTRLLGFILVLFFHITNRIIFNIGVFHWLGIGSTVVFVEPEAPRYWLRWLPDKISKRTVDVSNSPACAATPKHQHFVAILVAAFLVYQSLMPYRHLIYSGDTNWTDEGRLFSWHLRLRDKRGGVQFHVLDATTGGAVNDFDPYVGIMPEQVRVMNTDPGMVAQFARHIRERALKELHKDVIVKADANISLNSRAYQEMVDPNADLGKTQINLLKHSQWIAPLRMPLPARIPEMPVYLTWFAAVLALGSMVAALLYLFLSKNRSDKDKRFLKMIIGSHIVIMLTAALFNCMVYPRVLYIPLVAAVLATGAAFGFTRAIRHPKAWDGLMVFLSALALLHLYEAFLLVCAG